MTPDKTDRDTKSSSENPPRRENEKSTWAQAAGYAELAFVFPAATVAGWLLGVGLDRWLHTTWLNIAGLILGIVAGFVELIRTVAKNQ